MNWVNHKTKTILCTILFVNVNPKCDMKWGRHEDFFEIHYIEYSKGFAFYFAFTNGVDLNRVDFKRS